MRNGSTRRKSFARRLASMSAAPRDSFRPSSGARRAVASPVQIEIYSRPGCHLCDDAKEVVERLQRRFPFSLRIVNIETDVELEKAYGEQIPVVFINGNKAF